MKAEPFRWFDRAFKPVARAKPALVECSGKCRKGAIDPDCKLHGVWGRA